MATSRKSTAPAKAQQPPSDATADRLRAFLASMRPTRDVEPDDESDEAIQRGRSLIERLALSAQGDGLPALRLSPEECADVLCYIHWAEPVRPANWRQDPDDAPSHVVGFMLLMQVLEDSLRETKNDEEQAEQPATDEAQSPEETEREPMSEAIKDALLATMYKLGNAISMLNVVLRSIGDELPEEEVVFNQALKMLEDVQQSIDYTSMGVPQTAPLWSDVLAHREALEEAKRELAQRQESPQ